MPIEVTLSAVVPLLVGLLNLLVAAYALTFGLRRLRTPDGRRAVAFAAGPAGVGVWALAWFVAAFDPSGLEAMRIVGGLALVLGVLGALTEALLSAPPRRRRWVLLAVGLTALGLVALVASLPLVPQVSLRLGLAARVVSLSGLGGVAMVHLLGARDPDARPARRTLLALALCGVGYAALAGLAYWRDRVGVDVLLFVVLALEFIALVSILEGRVRVEVLLARALSYAFLAVVVAAVAAWVFRELGYDVDLVTITVTVAIALVASALFMGLGDPLTRRLERALFPEHARLEARLDASRQELSELRRRLAHAERLALAGELAASVAHEIKNPLAPVRGYAQMLTGRLEAVEAHDRPLFEKGLRIIQAEADRIDARVTELLDLSRAQSASLEAGAAFELQSVLRDAVLVVEAEPGAATVRTRGMEAPVQVLGDPDGVRGAIVNLLKNAAEAMRESGPGAIEIAVEIDGDEVLVRIDDEGPGLPAEEPERAFEAFYTTKRGGTGLGLAIAKSAVQAAGGQVALAARTDRRGARAEVRLLRAERQEG